MLSTELNLNYKTSFTTKIKPEFYN